MRSVLSCLRWALVASVVPTLAFAEEHAAGAGGSNAGWIAVAVGIGLAFAVMAATTAQGRIASSFMDGASRNPGAADVMKGQLILSLAFVESLVLFTVLIGFMLLGKM